VSGKRISSEKQYYRLAGTSNLSVLDVDQLLAAISDDSPAGDDLEYDPDFGALERAAQGKAEQVMGDEVVPAEEPAWGDVYDQAQE
jgi:type VI secretion system protein ImpA